MSAGFCLQLLPFRLTHLKLKGWPKLEKKLVDPGSGAPKSTSAVANVATTKQIPQGIRTA